MGTRLAEVTQPWLMLAGLVLLAAVAVDVLRTVLDVSHGGGPITGAMGRRVWLRLVAWHHRGLPGSVLRVGGLLVTVSVVGIWLAGLIAGWGLIYLSGESALVSGSSGVPVGVVDRLYFASGGLFTQSLGDVLPGSSFWRMVTAANVGSGLLVLTLSITYAVPVIEAATRRRVFASTVATLGDSSAEIVANHVRNGDSSPLLDELATLRRDVIELSHLHLAYPVLHYFHSPERRSAFGPNLAALYDALVILESGCRHHGRPDPRFAHTRTAIEAFLDPLLLDHHATHRPPRVSARSCMRPGCPGGREKILDAEHELAGHRRKLAALVHEEGWTWPEVPVRKDGSLSTPVPLGHGS